MHFGTPRWPTATCDVITMPTATGLKASATMVYCTEWNVRNAISDPNPRRGLLHPITVPPHSSFPIPLLRISQQHTAPLHCLSMMHQLENWHLGRFYQITIQNKCMHQPSISTIHEMKLNHMYQPVQVANSATAHLQIDGATFRSPSLCSLCMPHVCACV